MFVNMATGQRGLVCHYDVVCFDEIAGVSFDSKDAVISCGKRKGVSVWQLPKRDEHPSLI